MTSPEPAAPQVWVDGDACPSVIKAILFRAAERAKIHVTLIANHSLSRPPSRYIRALVVRGGLDEADNEIVERMSPGDLVVTQDIPLAARVIDKGGVAINPAASATRLTTWPSVCRCVTSWKSCAARVFKPVGRRLFMHAIGKPSPINSTAGWPSTQ
jgi:hypothetical protein